MKQAHEHQCMKLNGEGGNLARTVLTARVIRGVKPWLSTLKPKERNEHLSRQIDLCEMLTSLLVMGIQMGEMSKLG
jgi:hypothetical protein